MIKYIGRLIARQVVRRIVLIVFAVIMALIPALMGGLSAHAASAYDQAYRTVEKLEVGSYGYGGDNCDANDLSQNWYTTALEAQTNDPDWKQSLQNAINGGGRWIVSQNEEYHNGSYMTSYSIFWTEDDSLSLKFDGNQNYSAVVIDNGNSNNPNNVLIRSVRTQTGQGSCDEYMGINYGAMAVSNKRVNENANGSNNFAFYIYIDPQNVTYPEGYQGEQITNTIGGGSGKTVIHPTISATITDKTVIFKLDEIEQFVPCSVNYMISYSDRPNNDYGETMIETLKNGWGQIIRGDITLEQWRRGGEPYNSKVIDFKPKRNPDNEVIVTAPDTGSILVFAVVDTEWPGAPYKSCGDNGKPDEFEYDVRSRLQFINIDGSTYAIDGSLCDIGTPICDTTQGKIDLMSCFTAEFPFFHLENCKKAIALVGERLSFNTTRFGNSWIHSPQCRQLGTLGDWIGANNRTVCPYFSTTVRNTIDPFVAFILGLLVVTFIARNTGKNF